MKEFDEMYNRNLDGQSDQQEPQQADVEIPVSRQNQWQDTSAQEQPAYSWQPAQSQPRQESIFGESQNTVKIDLSGGAQPQGGSSIPGMVNGPIYTEHVQHQKDGQALRGGHGFPDRAESGAVRRRIYAGPQLWGRG